MNYSFLPFMGIALFAISVSTYGEVIIKDAKQTPFVRKDGKQEVSVQIDNKEVPFNGTVRISVREDSPYSIPLNQLKSGELTVTIPVTDTNKHLKPGECTRLKMELFDNAECQGTPKAVYTNDKWARTKHWEFYLSQSIHCDLGYTDLQEPLRDLYTQFLDDVKLFMKNSDERGDLQKYKYDIESGYILGEGFMKRRNADEIQDIVHLIKEGRMTIGAGQFNYVTEAFSTEEAARAPYYTNRFLVDKLGIEPVSTQRMFDNPAFSKGYIDAAVQSGIKYGVHSMNPDRSPYYKKKLYDIFYMQGFDPKNKLLIFNWHTYGDHMSFNDKAEAVIDRLQKLITTLEGFSERRTYPYDKYLIPQVPYGDNKGPSEREIIVANEVNKKWQEAGYEYPRVNIAFSETFFRDIETEYATMIPTETGTEENWWNDGWGTTAYESGINKLAGRMIPVAETMASLSSLLTGKAYPYDDLHEAMERNLVYDEHTWGYHSYVDTNDYHHQFEWKRSNAFSAKALGEKVRNDSLNALASRVKTQGKAIYVYNPLNWNRDDVVTLTGLDELPEHFEIQYKGERIPNTVQNGTLTFIAPQVPALGYKTFDIIETKAQGEPTSDSLIAGKDFIQNQYYKVSFGPDGTISSILDLKNNNRELVDNSTTIKFNQYQYYDDFGVNHRNEGQNFEGLWKLYVPDKPVGKLLVEKKAADVSATIYTSTFRTSKIKQKVTLYDKVPRIDIVNEVVKESLPQLTVKEEAFYTFPFKAESGYSIQYDLPVGNTAEGEQVYGTSHDWYTANKWVSVKDKDGYNMTIALPDTALLQFGERRTGQWSFDYKSTRPFIYSYVMNNMWQTNFQGDQPGYVKFSYSIISGQEKSYEKTSRFGWEISTPLQACIIGKAQNGSASQEGQLLNISADNVQLTTMKTAESNGEGMILRFHETQGKNTQGVKVALPFAVSEVVETTPIEQNKRTITRSSDSFSFDIPAYGISTFRLLNQEKPKTVEHLSVLSSSEKVNVNLANSASVTASSYYDNDHHPDFAKSLRQSKDWASRGEQTPWLKLEWATPVNAKSFLLADRSNHVDNLEKANITLTLTNGSTVKIDEIKNLESDGTPFQVSLDKAYSIKSMQIDLKAREGTLNAGLSGVEVYEKEMIPVFGTSIQWQPAPKALYYEIFRGISPDINDKSWNHLASTKEAQFFDTQVTGDMRQPYYYSVRAVAAGAKSDLSSPVRQKKGSLTDSTPPNQPLLDAQARNGQRIDLFWTPVNDNIMVSHYEIHRNGQCIAQTKDNYICSYRDLGVSPGNAYEYTVIAVDKKGNKTASQRKKVSSLN